MADPEEVLQSSLADTERLIIQQEVELLEAGANAAANAVGMDALGALGEQANKYDIFTDTGGKKFRVIETSEYCGFTGKRCLCIINIINIAGLLLQNVPSTEFPILNSKLYCIPSPHQ